jgi:Rod binding domain-containing protein
MDTTLITAPPGPFASAPRVSPFASESEWRDNSERELFSTVISRAQRSGAASREAEAREAARGLVSAALVQPILKQLRESKNAAPPPFGPGPGERSFREMMDATVAQKLVTSQNWPLVDRLARDLLRRSGGGIDPASPATSTHQAQSVSEQS